MKTIINMKSMLKPVHPGRIIKDDYLEPLEMSVSDLAIAIGVTRPTMSAIINERSAVSPEMALRLAQAFDTTPELWITMQRHYDLYMARQKFSAVDVVKQVYSSTF